MSPDEALPQSEDATSARGAASDDRVADLSDDAVPASERPSEKSQRRLTPTPHPRPEPGHSISSPPPRVHSSPRPPPPSQRVSQGLAPQAPPVPSFDEALGDGDSSIEDWHDPDQSPDPPEATIPPALTSKSGPPRVRSAPPPDLPTDWETLPDASGAATWAEVSESSALAAAPSMVQSTTEGAPEPESAAARGSVPTPQSEPTLAGEGEAAGSVGALAQAGFGGEPAPLASGALDGSEREIKQVASPILAMRIIVVGDSIRPEPRAEVRIPRGYPSDSFEGPADITIEIGEGDASDASLEEGEIEEADADVLLEEARERPPPPPKRRSVRPVPEARSSVRPSRGQRRRPWWEEIFSEDFLPAERPLTDPQLKSEADFIEHALAVERGGSILDVGCGSGQHAVELASRGYQLVGYDLSLDQLSLAADLAQERAQRLSLLQGDMRELAFQDMFDGLYCWNTTFGYFEEEKNSGVAARFFNALKPGGRLVLDIINRDYVAHQTPSQVWYEGARAVCMDDAHLDFITSRLKVKRSVIMDDGRTRECSYSLRVYSLHEIGKLLHDVGFRIAEATGHPATPGVFFGQSSPRLIILAQKP